MPLVPCYELLTALLLCVAACASDGTAGGSSSGTAGASTTSGATSNGGTSGEGTTGGGTTGGTTGGQTTAGNDGDSCQSSSDCKKANPCCDYESLTCVTLDELGPSSYCTCNNHLDCAFTHKSQECVPLVDPFGEFVGPYACIPNDGQSFDGCRNNVECSAHAQFCASDAEGREYCSKYCEVDRECGVPGQACCNAFCDGGSCCGLCGI